MLEEMAEIGMVLGRALARQVEATGRCGPEEAASYDTVFRAMRRGIALREKLFDDSLMTDDERAAARRARDAAAAQARLRARKDDVRRDLERAIGADAVARDRDRADTERLLCELNERLADPDIDKAFSTQDNWAIVLGICKDLEIVPRADTWSDRAMEIGIADTREELRQVAAAFSPSAAAAAAAGSSVAAPVAAVQTQGVRKIGRFTFGPSGAVIAEDPIEPGFGAWAKDYQRTRDPPDTG